MTGLWDAPRPLDNTLRFVPYAVDVWCPVLESVRLPKDRPVATELLGEALVLFRDGDGGVRALEDRCPHRGVALSLGEARDGGVRCGYHGWQVGPDGAVVSAPGVRMDAGTAPRARPFAAREAAGLVWVFVGAPERATQVPLPLGEFGKGLGAETVLSMEMRAHWSFVLDNGLDLFHQHLHRDVPFFFEVHALESFGPDGDAFALRYAATLRDTLNRKRKGAISIRLEANALSLDFAGFPLIQGVPTPRSADGRRITMWWLVTFPAGPLKAWGIRAMLPKLEAEMLRGFQQDAVVLESETRAFERAPDRPQLELNPVVARAHQHVRALVARRARQRFEGASDPPAPQRLNAADLSARARRGEVGVLAAASAQSLEVLHPDGLAARAKGGFVDAARYAHFWVLVPQAPELPRSAP